MFFLVFVYTEKPNVQSVVGEVDGLLKYWLVYWICLEKLYKVIERSRLEPKKVYEEPHSVNHEYGWIPVELVC